MVKYYGIEGGVLVATDAPGPLAVYVAPTEDEVNELVEQYQIDKHNIDSSLDPDEIGRLELDPETQQIAIILKRPRNYSSKDNLLFRVMSIGVFLFPSRLVIVTTDDAGLFERKYMVRIKTVQDILIKLIHTTIAHFTGHLKVINMISDELEQKISKSMENKFLLDMFMLQKSLVYFVNALNDNATIIGKLRANAARAGFSEESIEMIDDLIIDNSQCLTLTQTYANILSNLMDARASVVSNNLNVLMKNLNAVVIAVAIPSFLAAMGGMSEFTQFTSRVPWPVSYGAFALVSAALGAGVFFLIRAWERRWR